MNGITNDNCLRENDLTNRIDMSLTSSSTTNVNDNDDVPDYNEAFPQLTSTNHADINRSNSYFSSSSFDESNRLANTTNSLYISTKADDDRRRKLAIHEKLMTTKIIEIPLEERIMDKSRRTGHPSSRHNGANLLFIDTGPPLQKICNHIQKETSTIVTFFYKDETLIITITGRPENVRSAQVQIVDELQGPIKIAVHIPLDFHRYIIGQRGSTLKSLERETLTHIAVPSQDSESDAVLISGAKDNVKLCEHKIRELYHIQLNKGFERLSIPCLYHPWIRYQLVEQLYHQYKVNIDLPPPSKQIDEISIRGEREPVEKAKAQIIQLVQDLNVKIVPFPLEIPCEQHRFILGKKGAGLKEIFDKTNVAVRVPSPEENSSIIQVAGEITQLGEAITMIYKMANALTIVQVDAPHWMHSVVKGERNANLDIIKKSYPDVRIFFRDDYIVLEGPPEQVECVRSQIQTVITDLQNNKTTYLEVDIDPKYYKQLIGKNQIRLIETQEKTGCDIKFPHDDDDHYVKLMGTQESVDKARQTLLERVQKLSNERTAGVSIDPQYYPQIIGSKGKKLEEVRSKFHNIQITFPEKDNKSNQVILHGDKDDVEKCSKFLQQKIKDLYSIDIEISKRLHPLLIGKHGSNIQRLREQIPDVRIEISSFNDENELPHIHLQGKRIDVDKARKILDEHISKLNISLENIIEDYITIDPIWHNRFFQNQRKLLNDLQQQYDHVLIKFPERKTKSGQVLLRGNKQSIEDIKKVLEELIDTWKNTITKEINIAHRYHGYLLAQGGSYIQPIEKQYNVQIKFPPRHNEQDLSKNNNIVRLIGRSDDIEKVQIILEKMIPIDLIVDIPHEAHSSLIGKNKHQLEILMKKYPDVNITFPPLKSKFNDIHLYGPLEQVEDLKYDLNELYEKYQIDKQARSYQVRFKIQSKYCSLINGNRRYNLKEKYDVHIQILRKLSTSDNKEQDENNLLSMNEIEILIIGYEDKVLACRNEILQLIEEFDSIITMEIEIDHRIHARIIGTGRQKLQQIMKEYNVDIKFPNRNQNDKVYVIGKNQDNIDSCIDHLLILEEDFLQDLPHKQDISNQSMLEQKLSNVQYRENNKLSLLNNSSRKSMKKQDKQMIFKVKNAPWTLNEYNELENQQQRMNNEHENSSFTAPNRDNLGEYPLFTNDLTDDNSSSMHETTVNPIPVIWGPSKRNK